MSAADWVVIVLFVLVLVTAVLFVGRRLRTSYNREEGTKMKGWGNSGL